VCALMTEAGCDVVPISSQGVCWVLPESCPGGDEHTARVCDAQDSCISECGAIKTGKVYVVSAPCH
jgi:hypothetical protein